MSTILPFPQPLQSTTHPVHCIYRQVLACRQQMDQASDYASLQRSRAAMQEALASLAWHRPESRHEAQIFSQAALLQLQAMISAWDDAPTPAEKQLIHLLEQLHDYLAEDWAGKPG